MLTPTVTAGPIKTRVKLLNALDITEAELSLALKLSNEEKYTVFEIEKSDGGNRKVHKPHYALRLVQRRINKRIFSNIYSLEWPSYLFGSIPNQTNVKNDTETSKDYIACASVHCKAKSILKLDVSNFFDNIHEDIVFDIFNKLFKYSQEVSTILTSICTHNGHLVQGALTSSYLACLSLFDIEHSVVKKLQNKKLRYTRFIDDITVSSTIGKYDFSYAEKVIIDMLTEKGLPLNKNKTKVAYASSEPLTVHGLRVSFDEPRLPANEVKKIRAAVKNIEILSSEKNYRTTHSYRHDFNKCMGRVNKLARVRHNQHQNLLNRLLAIYPLPSKKDILRAKKMVQRLEADHSTKKATYWYSRRFYLAHERLNILKRSFPNIATILRIRLREIQPCYD